MKTSNIQQSHNHALIAGWVKPGTAGTESGTGASGGNVAHHANTAAVALVTGDVVVLASDGSVTTTTTARDTRRAGVVLDNIAIGAYGPVAWAGPVDLIGVTASVTAGHWAETSTTAAKAQSNGSTTPTTGSFGMFTSTGTTPSIFLGGGLPPGQALASLLVISPAQLTANTDNWAPTGYATADVIRVSTDASRNLTGIVAPTTTRVLILENVGAFDLVLKHNVTSTAANRFYCPNDTDVTLQKDSAVVLVYDLTSARWRVVGSGGGAGVTYGIPALTYGTPAAGSISEVIRRDAVIAKPTEADISLADNTTANVSTTKHGFAPKLDNSSAHFLDGTGAWSTPASSTGEVVDPIVTKFGTADTAYEFNTSSLTGLTAFGSPATEDADTTVPGCLYYRATDTTLAWHGRYISTPTLPFTVITKVLDATSFGNYNSAGLIVGAGAPASNAFVANALGFNGQRQVDATKFTSRTAFSASIAIGADRPQTPSYVGIVVNSATSVDFFVSYNGWLWRKYSAAYNPSFTPAIVGVGMKSENAAPFAAAFDFFRIWNSAKTFPGA